MSGDARLSASTRPDRHTLDFDLIVIGGGSGGLAAAFRASEHGARVAMLEPGELGGTCVNVGCVPKKAMWLAAQLAGHIELSRRLGFDAPCPTLDWCAFVAHRQRYIANIHASYRRRLDASGIVTIASRGRFVDAHTIETGEGARLRAPHIVIATGARPQRPDLPGGEFGLVSDDFFHLTAAPGRVAVVGGGYIGVELTGVLQALGSGVELFVRGPRLLDGFDADLTERLAANYAAAGVRLHLGHRLAAIERAGDTAVRLVDADGAASEPFDALIFATGRRANSDDLGLDAAGIVCDARGHVCVDQWQGTNLAGVYAMGDVTDRLALTPVAIAAARRLMDRVFGGKSHAYLDYDDIPTVVFAHPPLAKAGLTEAQARARHGDAVRVYRAEFRAMLQALAGTDERSLFKVVCVGEDERVVGIHLLGDGADEILQGFAVALKRGITLDDLRDTVAIHPTSAEEVVLIR
ncbi:MAG: glutathione-disulfide reductase [Luteimonas sp.]